MAQVSDFLKQHGCIVAERFGNLRVSPHVYNTEEDLDRMCFLAQCCLRAALAAHHPFSAHAIDSSVKQRTDEHQGLLEEEEVRKPRTVRPVTRSRQRLRGDAAQNKAERLLREAVAFSLR
jgi:hypothetical protein